MRDVYTSRCLISPALPTELLWHIKQDAFLLPSIIRNLIAVSVFIVVVLEEGYDPSHLKAQLFESCMSTNSIIPAYSQSTPEDANWTFLNPLTPVSFPLGVPAFSLFNVDSVSTIGRRGGNRTRTLFPTRDFKQKLCSWTISLPSTLLGQVVVAHACY